MATSAPMPAKGQPSSTTTNRLVFFTLSTTVAVSSGRKVRRLITSASIPCSASCLAASRATPTMIEKATMVTCEPARSIFALPMGRMKSSSSGQSKVWPYRISFSRNTTGLGSRIDARSRPLASADDQGATTFSPGTWAYQLA